MKSVEYYNQCLIFCIINISLFSLLIKKLENVWFATHVFLCFAYLLIAIIGLYGLSNKKLWSPGVFLILFGVQAINALFITILLSELISKLLLITTIISIYISAKDADLLIKINKFKRIKTEIELTKINNV